MTKLTKIMLAMIASLSLLSTSYAGEVTVTGNAEATYSISGAKTGTGVDDTDTVGGKGIGVANEIDFTATGETDNGYTWKYQTQFDDGTAVDDGRLEVTSPFGTLGFYVSEGGMRKSLHGVGALGSGFDYHSPASGTSGAFQTGYDVDGYANVQYHTPADMLPFGATVKIAYAPSSGSAAAANNSYKAGGAAVSEGFTTATKVGTTASPFSQTAQMGRSATHYQVTASPIDGLTIGYAQQDVEVTTNTKGDESTMYAKYAIGGFTVGIQMSENDMETGSDYESTGIGVSYQVNDDLAISYGNHEIEEVSSGNPDQEAAALSFSYTMGSLGIVGTVHDVDNIDNSSTNSREAYSLGLSFNF